MGYGKRKIGVESLPVSIFYKGYRIDLVRGEVVLLAGNKRSIACKNVFKNKSSKEMQLEFTKRWIELIHYLERNKQCGE